MDQHDSLGFLLHGGDPFEQTIPVSMAGEALDHFDPGFDGDLLTKNPDRLCPSTSARPRVPRAWYPTKMTVESLRQRLCLRWWRIRPASHIPLAEMMILLSGSSLSWRDSIGGLREMQIVEIQRMIAAFDVGTGFVIKAVGVFLEHLGR